MKLRFLGTRGEIESRSPRHRRHSSLLVGYRGRTVLFDCGADWLDDLPAVAPQALFLTHAHPDHAGGLRRGAPWPVHATRETWRAIVRYPIAERRVVEPGEAAAVGAIRVVAFRLEHSLRAPAVGYRVAGSRRRSSTLLTWSRSPTAPRPSPASASTSATARASPGRSSGAAAGA